MLRRYVSVALLAAATISAAPDFIGNAVAATKKKMTYEEAWIYCKNKMDSDKVYGTQLMSNERFLRGGACMKHFGYNL
jgi:hypothetical protein